MFGDWNTITDNSQMSNTIECFNNIAAFCSNSTELLHFTKRETEMQKGYYWTAFVVSYFVKKYWPPVAEAMQADLEFTFCS